MTSTVSVDPHSAQVILNDTKVPMIVGGVPTRIKSLTVTIDRQGFDDRCFAAGLLGLGSRGVVKIRRNGDGFEMEPTGKQVEFLAGERAVAPLAQHARQLQVMPQIADEVAVTLRADVLGV